MAHYGTFTIGGFSTAVVVAFALVRASAAAAADVVLYRKCCPEFEGLSRVTGEFSDVAYRCISRPEADRLLNGSSAAGAFVVADPSRVVYGFPDGCDSTQLSERRLDASEYSASAYCIDKVLVRESADEASARAGDMVALSCAEADGGGAGGGLLEMERLRRCCADGLAYDATTHACRPSERAESAERLVRRFAGGAGAIDVHVGLRCRAGRHAMSYTEERFELEHAGRRLVVRERASGAAFSLHREEYCVEVAAGGAGGALVARGCRDACEAGAACVRKCCEAGQNFVPSVCGRARNMCVDGGLGFSPTFFKGRYMAYKEAPSPGVWGIAPPFTCPSGRFALTNKPEDEHFLLYSGDLVVPSLYGHYPTTEYCLEVVDRRACGGSVTTEAVLCFQAPDILPFKFTTSFVVIGISCLFLALTLVVYGALSELRNLHGMTLMCHVASMLLGFGCLARVQYGHIQRSALCKLHGYVIYFAFVAAFSWLCVMCFDIWWTFGSVNTVQRMRRAGAERRRFAWYSLCAWGAPVALTGTMLALDLHPVSPYLDANIGQNFCWFGAVQNAVTDWPHYIFFVGPLGVVVVVNLVLWVCTARHCARVKAELHRMQAGSVGDRAKRRFRADRAKYTLCVKLWVVMGASWVWEVLSTMVEEPLWLWFGVDLVNQLQGLFIFAILVLKPKVYFLVRKRLGLEKSAALKPGDGRVTSTRSTFLSSRSISADTRASQPPPVAAPATPAADARLISHKDHDM